MAEKFPSRSSIFVIFAIAAICAIGAADAGMEQVGWIHARSAPCKGSMAECLGGDFDLELEGEMESEMSRRILATNNYISYGALQKNSVPCSRRGASYYNCKPGAQSNPYSRGCSSISRCRR